MTPDRIDYTQNEKYNARVAYYSMELAVVRALKYIAADWDFYQVRICFASMS
jgi:hypothetical protein